MIARTVLAFLVAALLAAPALAQGPSDLGGNSSTWEEGSVVPGSTYYQNTRNPGLIKNWNSTQGIRFTIPGKSEGKADSRSVVGGDPIHPGTQVFPGSNSPR